MDIDQFRLKALLNYDRNTGIFTWIVNRRGRAKAGSVAGKTDGSGYRQIMVDNRYYLAHRLAFLYMNGSLPDREIEVDHINGNPCDNRWDNIRLVTGLINRQNKRKASRNNKSGLLGVSWSKSNKCWHSRISLNGESHFLGGFSSPNEAHEAYLKAKRKLHVGCTI